MHQAHLFHGHHYSLEARTFCPNTYELARLTFNHAFAKGVCRGRFFPRALTLATFATRSFFLLSDLAILTFTWAAFGVTFLFSLSVNGLRWAKCPAHVETRVASFCFQSDHAAGGGLAFEAHHHPNLGPLRGKHSRHRDVADTKCQQRPCASRLLLASTHTPTFMQLAGT